MDSNCELDSCLWSQLPQEILEAVFARLPTESICRTRVLSKSWKRTSSTCSTFTRLCAKSHPTFCGLIWSIMDRNTEMYVARVYDTESCKWLNLFSLVGIPDLLEYDVETACDGGLVCFVPSFSEDLDVLPVYVCNPLTGECRELPLQRLVRECKMVQLKVDPRTGSYTIILVAYVGGGYYQGGIVAEVYNSSTTEWSRLHSGLILGYDEDRDTLHVCDCSTGVFRAYAIPVSEYPDLFWCKTQLNNLLVMESFSFEFSEDWMRNGDGSRIEANYPEEVFSQFTVTKYEDGNWGFGVHDSSWGRRSAIPVVPLVPPTVYNCIGVYFSGQTWLFVTGTFLMIICYSREDHQLMMLYDMEKGKWHEFDRTKGTILSNRDRDMGRAFSCDLRWDACP